MTDRVYAPNKQEVDREDPIHVPLKNKKNEISQVGNKVVRVHGISPNKKFVHLGHCLLVAMVKLPLLRSRIKMQLGCGLIHKPDLK